MEMIRQARRDDIAAIRAIMKAETGFWQENWRPDVLERALESSMGLAFVCAENGAVVGFICGHDLGFRAYLSELIVAGTHKGKGVGRRLLEHLESELVARGCSMLIADVWKDAKGFYEAMGWAPPDVVLLRKQLQNKDSQSCSTYDAAPPAAGED